MPILRDTPPPLPASVLKEIRDGLPARYGSTLMMNSGRAVLLVRVPYEMPDPQRDIGVAADLITLEEASLARDVLLMGEEKTLRIDPIPLRDVIRERVQADVPVSKEVRRQLPHGFAATLFTPMTRRVPCIAVRVPRAHCRDTTDDDLASIARALEPVLQQAGAMEVPLCYLVADEDFRRFTPEGLVRVLNGEAPLRPPKDANHYQVAGDNRPGAKKSVGGASSPFGMLVGAAERTDEQMASRKQTRTGKPVAGPAPTSPTPAPAPAPAIPRSTAPPAPALGGLTRSPAQAVVQALAPAPARPVTVPLTAPVTPVTVTTPDAGPAFTFAEKLRGVGFEVLPGLEDVGATFAAHLPGGKRLLVWHVPTADAEAVTTLQDRCKNLDADAGVLLADHVAPGAWVAAAGTTVSLLPASHIDAWVS